MTGTHDLPTPDNGFGLLDESWWTDQMHAEYMATRAPEGAAGCPAGAFYGDPDWQPSGPGDGGDYGRACAAAIGDDR